MELGSARGMSTGRLLVTTEVSHSSLSTEQLAAAASGTTLFCFTLLSLDEAFGGFEAERGFDDDADVFFT